MRQFLVIFKHCDFWRIENLRRNVAPSLLVSPYLDTREKMLQFWGSKSSFPKWFNIQAKILMMNLQLEIIFHLHENWFHGGRFGREWEFGAFFCAGGSSVAENLRALAKVGIVPQSHSVWKSLKMSHSTLRAKRATITLWVAKKLIKSAKNGQFGEF